MGWISIFRRLKKKKTRYFVSRLEIPKLHLHLVNNFDNNFVQLTRVGGGKPPVDRQERETEELRRTVYLVLTLRPLSMLMVGVPGGTTTMRSIK